MEKPTGMNIVLLGSDTRASSGAGGRSDTIIIVHIDPDKDILSMLSIPRDHRVDIPGHGKGKINTAYTYGGPALVIRTVKSVFGIKLDHYMEIDFNAFKAVTDTLGGVYVDVDRGYDDGKIVFDPGYQLLDGQNALRYCRHRHDSNYDFGRMERQQRFLNAVREQAMGWNLPFKLPGLIKGLFNNVDTDITANEFLKLAYWGIKLDGGRMTQAKLTGAVQTINGGSFVVASAGQIKSAVKDFLTEPAAVVEEDLTEPAGAILVATDLSGVSLEVVNASGRVSEGALAATWLMRQGATVLSVTEAEEVVVGDAVVTYPQSKAEAAAAVALALSIQRSEQSGGRIVVTIGQAYGISGDQIPVASAATASAGGILDAAKWSRLADQVTFKLMAPTFLPGGVSYSFQRNYAIKAGGKDVPAVRVGYRLGGKDVYMGISATTWTDAPIASPGYRVKGPGGVIFRLVGSSTKTDHIWWIQDDVLYWVSNTLTFDLSREEMLAAALSALPVTPTPAQ
jgi:LCP family protein required for cell wall assembly